MRRDWVVLLVCGLLMDVAGCGSSSRARPLLSASDGSASFVDAVPADASCTDGPGVPGAPCGCNGECIPGAECRWVFGPDYMRYEKIYICTTTASGTCFPGGILDDRCTNGAFCLYSRAPDAPAVCLTPEEKALTCAGPLAAAFLCSSYGSKDAGPWADGEIP